MKHILSFLIILSLFPPFAFSEEEETTLENPLTATMQLKKITLSPGEQVEVRIGMQLAETYHAYLDKFKLQSTGEPQINIGQFTISPISEFKDTFSGKMKKGIKGVATLTAILELPENFPTGTQTIQLKLTYQACTKKHCLFPKKIPLSEEVTIQTNNSSELKEYMPQKKSSTGFFASITKAFKGELTFKQALAQGSFFAFLFIFLAGILTSLTPCVYPMIPITLAVIGAKSKDQSQFKSFILSIFYVLGIAITFSTLGIIAALTGSLFGSALSNPIVVTIIAIVFVLLGLSMYGLFEIQAPTSLRNKAASQKTNGYLGAIFAGLVSGIVAGPCIGPVLIGVLAHVSERQDAFYGFSLLFTYSIGMGLLFILLGTFSGLLNKLPKARGWMDGVKFIFGTTMIAMALYYIEPLASDRLFYALLASTMILISSFYGAFLPNSELSPIKKLQKGLMLSAFLIGIFFALKAIIGPTFLSLTTVSKNTINQDKMKWTPFSDQALENAKTNNQPVIIDFYADWCVACKELETITFVNPKVKELGKQFTLLKFDATESTDKLTELKKRYAILGLPTILFIDRNGEVQQDITLTGFEEAPEFLQRMNKIL